MKFLEKDLEEIIFESDKEDISERGLPISGKLYRQLRIGNYGVSDLIEFSKFTVIRNGKFSHHMIDVHVYELKKDKIGVSAFMQALNYLKGIKSYLSNRFPNTEIYYSIVLIGKAIDANSSFVYLPEFLENSDGACFLHNYTYSYELDGLSFNKQVNYKLTNEGFNNVTKSF